MVWGYLVASMMPLCEKRHMSLKNMSTSLEKMNLSGQTQLILWKAGVKLHIRCTLQYFISCAILTLFQAREGLWREHPVQLSCLKGLDKVWALHWIPERTLVITPWVASAYQQWKQYSICSFMDNSMYQPSCFHYGSWGQYLYDKRRVL